MPKTINITPAPAPIDPERLIDLLTQTIEFCACAIRSIAGGDDPTKSRAHDPVLWAFQCLSKVVEMTQAGPAGELARLKDAHERLRSVFEGHLEAAE